MDQSSSHPHPQDPEKGKFIPSSDSPENSGSLPEGYGDNRLVIMPRDPLWFFAYWELTSARAEAARHEIAADIWEKATFIIRVYDVTDHEQEGVEGASYSDVEVERQARSWYVRVEKSGRWYMADLGLRLPDGRFFSLLRSNRIRLPVGRISDKTDSQWMAVGAQQVEWTQFLEGSANTENLGRGSAEISKNMAQRWEFLRSVFSGSSSTLSGSSGWTPPVPIPADEKK